MSAGTQIGNAVKRLLGINEPGAEAVREYRTATLTSAAAGTAVAVVPVNQVPKGHKFHLEGFRLVVNGGTAWTDTTATKVELQDSDGNVIASFAKAGLTANAVLEGKTANVTYAAGVNDGSGVAGDKGLQLKADANFAAGSDIKFTLWGIWKKV